jgi:hypothetical protein
MALSGTKRAAVLCVLLLSFQLVQAQLISDPRLLLATFFRLNYLVLVGDNRVDQIAGRCPCDSQVYYKYTFRRLETLSGNCTTPHFTVADESSCRVSLGCSNSDSASTRRIVLCRGFKTDDAYETVEVSLLEEWTGMKLDAVIRTAKAAVANDPPRVTKSEMALFGYFRRQVHFDSLAGMRHGRVTTTARALSVVREVFRSEYLGDTCYDVELGTDPVFESWWWVIERHGSPRPAWDHAPFEPSVDGGADQNPTQNFWVNQNNGVIDWYRLGRFAEGQVGGVGPTLRGTER